MAFYVTTAIFYANDRLHIGHCYESLAADVLARYHRAQGERVFLLTGTDEHGIKIERKARELGCAPEAFVAEIADSVRHLSDTLGISYDDFIRTTEDRHRLPVQQIFQRLYEQGDIYLDEYQGLYCQYDEAFITEAAALEGHLCPECARPLEWTREPVYRFRLSRYAAQVEQLLAQPGFLVPDTRRNELLAFVRGGLTDIAVSRTTVRWGIPVPFDPTHTIYVWVDALSNYITALGYGSDDPSRFREFWPASIHVVGKDIARFHAVVWPALLLALGQPVPGKVFAHGWLNVNGEKISKSRGNAVDPYPLIFRYGLDAVRYYLLRELPFGPDGNFSETALVLRTNVDLANDLGNLLSRTTALIERFRHGSIPDGRWADGVLEAAAGEAVRQVEHKVQQLRFGEALSALWELVGRANKYVDEQAPWALARDPEQVDRLCGVLYSLAETLRVVAAVLVPFLVQTPERIYGQLGLDPTSVRAVPWRESTRWGGLRPGTAIHRGDPLFPRILSGK